MIIFDSLKIKIDPKPITGAGNDYQSAGYSDDDRALVLVSDDMNALDTFVTEHSDGLITVGELLKDLQNCPDVFIGECTHTAMHDHKIVGYKGGYKYVFPLYPSIIRALNKKNAVIKEISTLTDAIDNIFKA